MKRLRHSGVTMDLMDPCSPALRPSPVPAYRVGEPLCAGRVEWPEGSRYSFGLAGHALVLACARVDSVLAQAVGRGPAEFALIVEAPLIVLAYRFGKVVSWGSAPFAWHLQPAASRILPPDDRPGSRTLLGITLVGSDDGIIHAQRSMTLSPEFTCVLHRAIRRQAADPFDPEAYVRAVGRVYLQRPAASSIVSHAVARTEGNA